MNELLWAPISSEMEAFAVRVALGGIGTCAIVLLAARVLRRRSEPLRYGVLFAGIVGLMAMPALVGVGQNIAPTFLGADADEEIVRIPAEMLPEILNRPAPEPELADLQIASSQGQVLGTALVGAWMLGVAVGLVRLVRALWKQQHVLLGSPWRAEFWTAELQAQLAQKLGLKKFPAVYLSPAAPMPMVIGIWRPAIVLPEQAPASWDRAQWEAILLHEGAHIARRDHWAVLAQHVAVLLFWWCPFAHLVARRLNELREIICDDYALQGPCDQIRYAEVLVESAERMLTLTTVPVPLALLDSAQSGLEARITRLLEKERRPMTKLSLFGKVAAAALLVVACLLTTAATAFSQAQPQPQKRVQIKIIVDGKEIDLGDAQLADLIVAAQKKAAEAYKSVVKPAPHSTVEKIAFSPDGKVLAVGDGAKVILFDAQTGKYLLQSDAVKGAQPVHVQSLSQLAQKDPRIEELVKQAEAIKPGSGAEVRKALQGAAKKSDDSTKAEYYRYIQRLAPAQGAKVEVVGDKKIIILTVQDGKVQQLSEKDLHKLLEKDLRFHLEMKHKDADPKKPLQFEFKAPLSTKPAPPVAVPSTPLAPPTTLPKRTPTAPADLEALQRQLERINAELLELRKRLEAGKR